MTKVFDIETDGFLEDLTKIHCINVLDRSTGKRYAFNEGTYADGSFAQHDGSIEDGLQMLSENAVAGQNIINYDIPAILKVYPQWTPPTDITDTLVDASLIWTDIKDKDLRALVKGRLPDDFRAKGLIGKQGLEAWGYRLGEYKGDFQGPWESFTQEMDTYGRQDPVVTNKLLEKIIEKNYSPEARALEQAVAKIIWRQTQRGFGFNVKKAEALVAKLQGRHAELGCELQNTFTAWYAPKRTKGTAEFTQKKKRREWVQDENGPIKRKVKGEFQRGHYIEYDEGATFTKIKLVVFNPASRDHIADRLTRLRGWRPTQFTDNGKPKVDETTLGALPWPEAKLLTEYLLIEKRLGQIATGKEAWLKHATDKGVFGRVTDGVIRIHGSVRTNGAVTGRMTHARPNIAQCPKVGVPYGEECRDLFEASPGLVLVGCDAEGLELRMLGHFMAPFDDGAYAFAVVNGKKEDETDVHNVNKKAAGLNSRDNSKTFIYALIYGAGDYKLGCIVYDDFTDAQRDKFNTKYRKKKLRAAALKRLGKARRARLMDNIPALGKLTKLVKQRVKKRGYLLGLDGRRLHIRSEHAALNTLLQSGGAVVMKQALVMLDHELTTTYRSQMGRIVEFVANVHDEFQIETQPEIADDVGKLAAECIRRAGEHFKLRCPLAGAFAVGRTWAETH